MLSRSGYCRDCGCRQFVVRTQVDINQHRLLCVLTCGIWLVVAGLLPARYGLWRCDSCGGHRVGGIRRKRSRREEGEEEIPIARAELLARRPDLATRPVSASHASGDAVSPEPERQKPRDGKDRRKAKRKAQRRARKRRD